MLGRSAKNMPQLPVFPYHRDPKSSDCLRKSDEACECCGKSPGILYDGVMYSIENPTNICPWCIADGSAEEKYDAVFFDADFCDDNLDRVDMPADFHSKVFGRTIGFATYNPIGWWVHCNEPAEYIKRKEPYEMIFQCKVCKKQHAINDLD